MLELNDDTFESETKNDLVIVEFTASWCPPCKVQKPILEKLEEETKLKVCFIDYDKNKSTASNFNIKSLPTLLFFKDGLLVETKVGLTKVDTINKILDKIKG